MQELTELALKARNGDRAAVHELLQHPSFRQRVKLIARRVFGRNPPAAGYWDAEDLEQDIYERVLTKMSGYRGDALITTWVDRIAQNIHINQSSRAALGDRYVEQSDWVPRHEESEENQSREMALKEAMSQLTPRQREILRLTSEGCTLEEMANRLYLSKSQVHRELKDVRGKLLESVV